MIASTLIAVEDASQRELRLPLRGPAQGASQGVEQTTSRARAIVVGADRATPTRTPPRFASRALRGTFTRTTDAHMGGQRTYGLDFRRGADTSRDSCREALDEFLPTKGCFVDADGQISRNGREPIEVELTPTRVAGYAAIVSLCGEHDIATSDALTIALAPIFGNVLVDLSACEFIDSTVIGALLAKRDDLVREGHRLELVVPRENRAVQRIVDVSGLHTILTVHDRLPGADAQLVSETT